MMWFILFDETCLNPIYMGQSNWPLHTNIMFNLVNNLGDRECDKALRIRISIDSFCVYGFNGMNGCQVGFHSNWKTTFNHVYKVLHEFQIPIYIMYIVRFYVIYYRDYLKAISDII
jgi:hypothetical protein